MKNLKEHIEELNNIIYQRIISGDFVLKKCISKKDSIDKEYDVNIDGINFEIRYDYSVWNHERYIWISEEDFNITSMDFLPQGVEFDKEKFVDCLESRTKDGIKKAAKDKKLKKLEEEKEALLKKIKDIDFQIKSLE